MGTQRASRLKRWTTEATVVATFGGAAVGAAMPATMLARGLDAVTTIAAGALSPPTVAPEAPADSAVVVTSTAHR